MVGGYQVFDWDPFVAEWASAAAKVARDVLQGDGERRHGRTWFVGVDALPNEADGSIAGVPLRGHWLTQVTPPRHWHAAQLSVVFPGYPQQDTDESDAAHRFRRNRDAAHVDGLLPVGPNKRRYLLEPHGWIAGIALNAAKASPLVVWENSHLIIKAAFEAAFEGIDPSDWATQDVTEIYQTARRACFETCRRIEVHAVPGQVILLDRHLLHGVAPWDPASNADMRMIAYFRPLIDVQDWL